MVLVLLKILPIYSQSTKKGRKNDKIIRNARVNKNMNLTESTLAKYMSISH